MTLRAVPKFRPSKPRTAVADAEYHTLAAILNGIENGQQVTEAIFELLNTQQQALDELLANLTPTSPNFAITYASAQGQRDGIIGLSTGLKQALA